LPFRDYTSALLALRQNRADALTGSSDILRGFIKTAPGFKIVGDKSLKLFTVHVVDKGKPLYEMVK